ncbi:MAG: hypothetical protein FWC89_04650 [Defluviitaleaceae bacterium]|nr:hypothetical protein [Defluviitaleaceae bacterium]
MPKPRKMLNDFNAPYIKSLMGLIETQSAETISKWCAAYAKENLLPLYEEAFPEDPRPRIALDASQTYTAETTTKEKATKAAAIKSLKSAVKECNNAAREAESNPAAQAAARACGGAAGCIYTPTLSIGLAFYGALALAYHTHGTTAPWETLESHAANECTKMESALNKIAIQNEPNPAKINWNC